MKVLHINTHMNIGGIGQYILSLCAALKSEGMDCVVASSGGDLQGELEARGIPHRYVDMRTKFEFGPKALMASRSLAGIVKECKIDIIHAHTRVSQVAAFLASRETRIPYVTTCHGFFKVRLFRRLFDSWGKKVIAISFPVKAHLERDFKINEPRIELIHNGVDLKRFSKSYSPQEIASAKRYLGLHDGPVIGTMGRLSPVKGQRFLIEAMAHVLSKDALAQCLIIGSGGEEKALRDLAKNLNIEKNIHFTGAVYKDMPLYLACMDIFVLPSIKEGLGLALLEAMASARPCIASDIGGINDITRHEATGLLVPVANSRAIGDAVLRLINDKALSAGLAQRGQEFVKEEFSIDSMAKKMAEVYEKVLNEN